MSSDSNILEKAFFVAFEEALKAKESGEVPVGACLLFDGEIIASSHNQIRARKDPTAHAEMEVLRLASKISGNERLPNTLLVGTLEPCSMCSGAIILARVKEVHFLAFEDKIPALRNVLKLKTHNHIPEWRQHELKQFPYSKLLKDFFKDKRQDGPERQGKNLLTYNGETS